MGKYDVFAMGNALLDTEVNIDFKFLENQEISKGVMNLIDWQRRKEILDALKTCQQKHCCGGSATNSIVAMSHLGSHCYFCFRVSRDEEGKIYLNDLISNGINFEKENSVYQGQTGQCLIMVTPDGDRTMNTCLGVSADFCSDDINLEELAQSKWLYIEGYLLSSQLGCQAVLKAQKRAKECGVKIAISLSDPWLVNAYRENFRPVLNQYGKLDMIFCNESEALSLTLKDQLIDAIESLKGHAHTFAITRGSDGVIIFDGKKEVFVKAPEVKVIDTNGAGDIFAGVFLYYMLKGNSFEESGEKACQAASCLVGKFGSRLSADELYKALGVKPKNNG